MTHAPHTRAAFDELISTLSEIRDTYLGDDWFADEIDVLDGYRYVGQLLSGVSEFYLEHNGNQPRIPSIMSPVRKVQGDNPDAIYHLTRLDGANTYRLRGRKHLEAYVSFTVHGEAADGGWNGPVLADINHHDFDIADDGTYEMVFSASEHDGNWVPIDERAQLLLVRSYFELPQSAHLMPEATPQFTIQRTDESASAVRSDEDVAADLRAGVAWLRQTTLMQTRPGGPPSPVPFVGKEPNTVGAPWSFRSAGIDAAGAVDIYYSSGRWNLQADEALVMTGTMPDCEFANVMLWNAHMQTLDYTRSQISLNRSQITPEADGTYRIVIAHEDPGVPNWLDVQGHATGQMFWRFLLPVETPDHPQCTVVPLVSLAGSGS